MKGLQRVCLFIILSGLLLIAVPVAACSTITQTGLTGNQSISVSDAASYDINITNHHAYVIGNDTFTHRKLLTVDNSSAALTDYQILKNITYDSDMQSNFGDLRFTTPDGTNVSFWIQDQVDGSYVNVWLKVPSISTTTGAEIWMYYGGHDSAVYATRYASNPVFSKNPTNPSWDYYWVNSPYIAINSDGTPYQDASNRYYMYYSASGNADSRVHNEDRIGLARSTDLYNWTRITSTVTPTGPAHAGLVLDFGASGTWDDCDTQIGAIIVKDGTFHMWYTGNDDSASDNTAIGYASSSDGITWTKYASNPILDNGIGDDDEDLYAPYVILDGDTWKMWYIGEHSAGSPDTGVMYATAPATEPWNMTKYSINYVFEHNQGNMWGPYVWKESGTYYMIFSSFASSPNEYYYADSPDGITWTDRSKIFGVGASGAWDEKRMAWISQIYVGSTWYSFYRGNDVATDIGQIGIFTSTTRLPVESGLSSTSSISDTFDFGDDFSGSSLDTNKWDLVGSTSVGVSGGELTIMPDTSDVHEGISANSTYNFNSGYIVTARSKNPSGRHVALVGFGETPYSATPHGDSVTDGFAMYGRVSFSTPGYVPSYARGANSDSAAIAETPLDYHKYDIAFETASSVKFFTDDVEKHNITDSQYITTADIRPYFTGDDYTSPSKLVVDYVFVRKYTATEPTWSTDGAEQDWSLTNITASVTGDSNTQEYNTTQLRNFTLTPTGTTNYVNVTTESTDYNITITTTSVTDTTDPTYSGATHSTTETGTACTFSIQYNDDTALHTNGQYIFSTNNSGAWVNESVVNFTATPQTIETIKTLNSTSGVIVGYRWYASDNAGNTADTPIYTLETTETLVTTYVNVAALVTGTALTVTTDMTGATFSTTGDSVWEYETGIDLFTGVGGLIVLAVILIIVSTVVLGMRGEMQIEKLIGITMGILVLVVIFPMIVMSGAQIEEVSDAGDGSTATLTITNIPNAGETIEINSETFTMTDGTPGPYLVDIGSSSDTEHVASQIVDSINAYSSVVSAV